VQAPLIRDTVKASVPKLFSCPGASASSPSREFSAERRFSATQKTYNTVGSRLLRRKPARFRGFPPCAQSKNISPRLPLWQQPVSSATAHQAKTIAARRLEVHSICRLSPWGRCRPFSAIWATRVANRSAAGAGRLIELSWGRAKAAERASLTCHKKSRDRSRG
jgi:hypothetical protein